jgi:hypothetical protein
VIFVRTHDASKVEPVLLPVVFGHGGHQPCHLHYQFGAVAQEPFPVLRGQKVLPCVEGDGEACVPLKM